MRTRLFCVILCSLVFPAAAHAWGGCNGSLSHHCYATIEGEVAAGTVALARVTVSGNNVPGSERGAFVTNELWIDFGTSENWIETGEISEGCCERRRFYAQQHPGSPFYLHVDSEPLLINETVTYGIRQCGGPWCITWNGNTVHSFGGWPQTYRQREFGIEIATESLPGSWGGGEGIEGNGSSWYPTTTYIAPGMEGRINPAEHFAENGAVECPSVPACIEWGMGSGSHDGIHSYKRPRPRKFKTVPVPRRAQVPHGRHVETLNPDGSIDLWIYPRHRKLTGVR